MDNFDFDKNTSFFKVPFGIRIPTKDGDHVVSKIEDLYEQYETLPDDEARESLLKDILYLAERQRTNPWDSILPFRIADEDEAFFTRELVRIENRISHGRYLIMWKGQLGELEILIQELISAKLIVNQYAGVKQFITRYFENTERKIFYSDSFGINYFDKSKISWSGTQKQLSWLIHALGKIEMVHVNMNRMYEFICDHFCKKDGTDYSRKYLFELHYRDNTRSTPLNPIRNILARVFPAEKIPEAQ